MQTTQTLGRIDRLTGVCVCVVVVHYTGAPVSIHISYGPFFYTDLGVNTLFEFLQPSSTEQLPLEKVSSSWCGSIVEQLLTVPSATGSDIR
jgi:hypothetical protein